MVFDNAGLQATKAPETREVSLAGPTMVQARHREVMPAGAQRTPVLKQTQSTNRHNDSDAMVLQNREPRRVPFTERAEL